LCFSVLFRMTLPGRWFHRPATGDSIRLRAFWYRGGDQFR
jgi:hypothetical protein